jgi:hypothetical protein
MSLNRRQRKSAGRIAHGQSETRMRRHLCAGAVACLLTAVFAATAAHAFDDTKYPNVKGQWFRVGGGSFVPDKRPGLAQEAPLTPEYQKILEASLADQAAGGQGNNPMGGCIPPARPRTMINYEGMEIVITPDLTYVLLIEPMDQIRRIYTDGRDFPAEFEPSYLGYSVGKWLDEDGDGKFDTLLVETRGIKPRHSYDSSGMPFHKDGKAVIKEKISLDKSDPNLLHDEITIFDNALTRPWTVTRSHKRSPKPPVWTEVVCTEDMHQVRIGKEHYYLDMDGALMPTRKHQPPPDLKHFDAAK